MINIKETAVWRIVFHINISWLLFGVSFGIMNSISGPVSKFYSWGESSSLIGLSNSIFPLGALIGGVSSGALMHSLGRRKSCAVSNAFFITSSLALLLFPWTAAFIMSRFLAGVAAGMVVSVCPKFANEFTPIEMNSKVGPWMSIFSATGFIVAYFYGVLIDLIGDDWICWSSSMVLIVFISAYQNFWLFYLLEFDSPVWYFESDNQEKCLESLKLVYSKSFAQKILETFSRNHGKIEEPLILHKNAKFSDVFFKKTFRKMMRIGLALASYQQLAGINVVLVYSNEIFEQLGIRDLAAHLMTLGLGFMLLFSNAFTVVALNLFGRKTILAGGAFFISADLLGLAVVSNFSGVFALKFALILAYLFFFSLSFGSTIWIYCAEVLNEKVMSLTVGANFLVQCLVCFGFDLAIGSGVKVSVVFAVFAIFMALAGVHCVFELVETKGSTKEEILAQVTRND